jgi:hypothetical protein
MEILQVSSPLECGYVRSMWICQLTYNFPILLDAATAAVIRKGDKFLARWADIMTGWAVFLFINHFSDRNWRHLLSICYPGSPLHGPTRPVRWISIQWIPAGLFSAHCILWYGRFSVIAFARWQHIKRCILEMAVCLATGMTPGLITASNIRPC